MFCQEVTLPAAGTEDTSDDIKLERHGVRVANGFLRTILPYPGLDSRTTPSARAHRASAAHLVRAGVKVGDSRDLNLGDNLVRVRASTNLHTNPHGWTTWSIFRPLIYD